MMSGAAAKGYGEAVDEEDEAVARAVVVDVVEAMAAAAVAGRSSL
jgi:hypothetical protein